MTHPLFIYYFSVGFLFLAAIMCNRPPMASFPNFLVLSKKTGLKNNNAFRINMTPVGHNSHLHSRISYCNINSCQTSLSVSLADDNGNDNPYMFKLINN
jgi:hypothetical protein